MKVLYVITGLGVGGAEKQLSAIVQRMVRHHDVRVCYLTGEPALLHEFSGVNVVSLGMNRTVWSVVAGYFRLRKLISSFEPDVVHSHMVHANILCRMMRFSINIPMLVCSAHNTREGGVLRMLAYRFTDRLAHVTTNVSLEAVRAFERLRATPVGKMKVAVNGVDTSIFKLDKEKREYVRNSASVKETDRVILSVGRLEKAKDFPNLLNAFALLSENDKSLKLWVVGEGNERSALRECVEDLGVADRVTFWGVRNDVDAFYNAADVYVLSSAWEGFGLVVAEAMATERVVVATDCGGVREVLGDQGFLVPVKDPHSLAQTIRKALALSDEDKRAMGKRARSRVVGNFSLDNVIVNWLHIYESRCKAVKGVGR